MTGMLQISAAELQEALDWPSLIGALRDAFANGCEAPPRHHHEIDLPDGGSATLLLMPAWRSEAYIGVKVLTIYPRNAEISLPAISALYVLFDGRDGRPVALLDGQTLTARRTAAASALAASYLAAPGAKTLLVVGTGRLCLELVAAHSSVRPITEVLISGRNPIKTAEMAARARDAGFAAQAAADLESAVRRADIVSCATLSTTPLVKGIWLKPGAHVDLVGAYRRDMRESDDEVFLRAAVVAVDTREGALGEAGDLLQPIAAGRFDSGIITADLEALCTGAHPGRSGPGQITVFKSVGASLEDLTAATLAYDQLSIGSRSHNSSV